ncbi:predicted GPI-anchored protein 58 [Sciurus carolinensis]|uniref:predicted GPI-anchored protein 58 n=1 Tax=Sciurus carolinensis TaxID=30640 RepID=UPI001FB4BE78|nr:predicted GPI-anchored protein 58 [Sciurus carolinensis]
MARDYLRPSDNCVPLQLIGILATSQCRSICINTDKQTPGSTGTLLSAAGPQNCGSPARHKVGRHKAGVALYVLTAPAPTLPERPPQPPRAPGGPNSLESNPSPDGRAPSNARIRGRVDPACPLAPGRPYPAPASPRPASPPDCRGRGLARAAADGEGPAGTLKAIHSPPYPHPNAATKRRTRPAGTAGRAGQGAPPNTGAGVADWPWWGLFPAPNRPLLLAGGGKAVRTHVWLRRPFGSSYVIRRMLGRSD